MQILTDREIIHLVDEKNHSCVVAGVKKPENWFSKDSPIQPTSLDLTIGEIYLPGVDSTATGSISNPLKTRIVEQGHTAIIVTKESLSFPSDLAGIGFPPSRLSIKGLLMINPGQIDPGSEGPLHFTVINMGKDAITLRESDVIFSLMFIKLHQGAERNLSERSEGPIKYNLQELIDRLSFDFMSIEERAEVIAKNEVKKVGLRVQILQILVPIIVAIIVGFGTWFGTWFLPSHQKFIKIEKEIAVMKQQIENKDIKHRLEKLENGLREINLIKRKSK